MTDFTILADKALRDELLTREECLTVLQTPDTSLLELLQAAFKVRERYFGKTVRLQMLLNAKSGACQEDCGYCSQSSVSTAPIERYGLLPQDQMVTGARRAAAAKPNATASSSADVARWIGKLPILPQPSGLSSRRFRSRSVVPWVSSMNARPKISKRPAWIASITT